jgi:protein-S-isoprenylcysteine O-methyltransferase Ste14
MSFQKLLFHLTLWCVDLVGVAWVAGAVYFAARTPGSLRHRLWHFVRTFFPEPWLLVLVPAVFALTVLVPHRVWNDLRFVNPVLALVGLAIVVVSTALMIWARWVLGTMWAGRPMVQDEHDLRTTGPYRLVRHPIYTGIAGLVLGTTLVFGFGVVLATLACTVPFVYWRIRAEERMMVATFGDEYRDYRRRVPALLPYPRPRTS